MLLSLTERFFHQFSLPYLEKEFIVDRQIVVSIVKNNHPQCQSTFAAMVSLIDLTVENC